MGDSASALWTRSQRFAWRDKSGLSAGGTKLGDLHRPLRHRYSFVNLPEPPETPRSAPVPRSAVIVMSIILAGMAFVAIYANVQNWRRDKLETVIVTPVAEPTPAP